MLAGFVAVVALFWFAAPVRVPSHFNAAGEIDDWSSRAGTIAALAPAGVGAPILLGIRWPWAKWHGVLNVPNKEYWLASGQHAGLTERVVTFMRLIAGLICGLTGAFLVVMLIDARATTAHETVPSWVFAVLTAAALAGMGLCVAKLFRDLKPE